LQCAVGKCGELGAGSRIILIIVAPYALANQLTILEAVVRKIHRPRRGAQVRTANPTFER